MNRNQLLETWKQEEQQPFIGWDFSHLDGRMFEQLNCRIGINSGLITAGVIEWKKISFNVWGDTVNTASRMQSHSLPGQIQVSQVTYELIKDDFFCEPRGTMNVKSKGEMDVWLVVSANK